jgi:glucosamine--fructose-6-phosphate aminotransferase (isomerizing)
MCGIFGLLSTTEREGPGEEFFRSLEDILRFTPETGSGSLGETEALSEESRAAVLPMLERLQASCYRQMGRGAFLEALRSLTRQGDWEFINRLIVGGRDVAWQLEQDLLGHFEPVLALLGESDVPEDIGDALALAHAWQLNLVLTSMDRLEVRGRDSAGIAVYLRFPGPRALDSFLDGTGREAKLAERINSGGWRDEVERRSHLDALTHGSICRPATSDSTLLAVFKVANEVGKMGDNTAFLRREIGSDAFFQAALRTAGVEIQCLAHTRWASNGIVSLPNCHPVDNAHVGHSSGKLQAPGEIVAVLNGDVDNYQELLERYVRGRELHLEESITTDAKIIPLVVSYHYQKTGNLGEAFRLAFSELEGSMAIGIMAADHPGEFFFGQKGSGQGLFLGLKEHGVAIASEMYGIVEFTPRYLKAEGERHLDGEVFRLSIDGDRIAIELCDAAGMHAVPENRIRTAEITTRDINRGDQPHFFLKEITESVNSVRETLRGKMDVASDEKGGTHPAEPTHRSRVHLGTDVLTPQFLDALRTGKIRKIHAVGQGTAAVAAEGIAHLLEKALLKARPGFQIAALKATELSGHYLTEDMSDTLVVAVSQSGTTTDTNRTVDMAKERGAWIISIVNRRNSDLVYKSHGVLYTSNGRDIEMSVASTKAFYAQNVAGQLLALALATELETLDDAELEMEVKSLAQFPAAMARTLRLEKEIAQLASRFSLQRRHWALVGSGMGKIAANEIRIKLSELCYKSIAVDFLEDKKHIDLSSEPLILVCANGIPPATISDIVKEVAIFKAHKSIPIVITHEGEDRFDPYAAGTIKVPLLSNSLNYLLATIVGHLFGYHAAARLDHFAERLRSIRAEVLSHLTSRERPGAADLPPSLTEEIVEMDGLLSTGGLDSGLDAGTAARLSSVFHVLLGWLPVNVFSRQHASLLDGIVSILSQSIAELSRPIDAIKHQAKTVTVGISRGDVAVSDGPLVASFKSLGLDFSQLAETHRRFLMALEPLVARLEGATLYRVDKLDPLGRPTDDSRIKVLRKTGCSKKIVSRSEEERPLSGTKWGAVKRTEIHIGFGMTDSRPILIVPITGARPEGHVLLYHLELVPRGRRELRLRALRAREHLIERLQIAITERNLPWEESLIDSIDNDVLFFKSPNTVAEELIERAVNE